MSKSRKEKAVCIIPFYNEEKTLENTIRVAVESEEFSAVVLVDDGSKDESCKVAESYSNNVILIRNKTNVGKGQSMINGYKAVRSTLDFDRVMFLDSDLVGFEEWHIREMLYEMDQGYGMVLGHYDWKSNREYVDSVGMYLFCTLWFPIVKQFTGERCLRKEIMDRCIEEYSDLFQNYGAEIVMNEVCKKMKLSMKYVELDGFYALSKQKKIGFWEGTEKNLKMFAEIIKKRVKMGI